MNMTLVCSLASLAQCGPSGCSPTFATPRPAFVAPAQSPVPPRASCEWRTINSEPAHHKYLFVGGVQVGCLDTREGFFRPYHAGVWGAKEYCDLQHIRGTPQQLEIAPVGEYPTGVVQEKLGEGPPVKISGKPATKREAMDALTGSVPDDRAKLFLTIIGAEADRKRVLADLADPSLREFRERLHVNDYPPDHWALRPGFVHDGKPVTISLQAPPDARGFGKELAHVTEYEGVETLRKIDPNYKPLRPRQPEPDKPADDGLSAAIRKWLGIPSVDLKACCLGALAAVIALMNAIRGRKE